jgi:NAD(P)-dependent dehydrogenase (short-subunit alcohol dehydrogenase family)
MPSLPVSLDLTGKVVLITGGSRGLGKAMVRAFAQAGADVIIASRNFVSCEELATAVKAETGRAVLPFACNVTQWEDIDGLVEAAYHAFGRLDVLVNNAGGSPEYDSLESVNEELFDNIIGLNLKGPFRLSAVVGARMVRQGGGSIINVTSVGAVHARPEILPYAAAKAGLNTLTVGLARAFGPSVRVNALMPGTFRSDASKSWDTEAFAIRAAGFALKRSGLPEEITGAALYLACAASSYTTGSVLTVDGGQP